MTSLFDTEVRARREHTPWARINVPAFMREMLWNMPHDANPLEHEVILRVRYRRDTQQWWSLEWTDASEQRARVESQYLDLLMWRAAEAELQARATVDRHPAPPGDVEISMEETGL